MSERLEKSSAQLQVLVPDWLDILCILIGIHRTMVRLMSKIFLVVLLLKWPCEKILLLLKSSKKMAIIDLCAERE